MKGHPEARMVRVVIANVKLNRSKRLRHARVEGHIICAILTPSKAGRGRCRPAPGKLDGRPGLDEQRPACGAEVVGAEDGSRGETYGTEFTRRATGEFPGCRIGSARGGREYLVGNACIELESAELMRTGHKER